VAGRAVFGVGATRPLILLGDATPGFQKGVANMVIFAGAKPRPIAPRAVPAAGQRAVQQGRRRRQFRHLLFGDEQHRLQDRQGNPAATAIRFHAAQHAYLSHMASTSARAWRACTRSPTRPRTCTSRAGATASWPRRPSPAWGFVLLDSTFEGQRDAAIREHEAGLTLVNVAMRDTPVGIEIDRGYGDWLWGKDVRFENVSKAGVVISNEASVYTQVGFENAVAVNTPVFARFRDSGKTVPGRGRPIGWRPSTMA
jgi:hypothetical protein